MGYAVLHLDKASANETKMTAHIERTQMPKNADPERTHLNRELIDFPEGVTSRTEAIQHRLDTEGLKRKIGINQVRAIRIVLTGSHDEMKRIEAADRLNEWCADNLAWLRKTYGANNLVSAVLHRDEATPHLHATIVPIVTGERRKVKEAAAQNKPADPDKKKYRKKDPAAARLCADDVMTRIKLKEYQDTYAGAMNKYGLERGIVGSNARHIATQEFYRTAVARQGNLQENIEMLLQAEESKCQSIEDLERKEQEARTRYKQADSLKQQKESELNQTEAKLKDARGQLKVEKFKNTTAEVGTKIASGIGSMLGTSKIERQQQEIAELKTQNGNLKFQLNNRDIQINNLRRDHKDEIERQKRAYENQADKLKKGEQKAIANHKQQMDSIVRWFPYAPQLAEIADTAKSAGFTDLIVLELLKLNPVKIPNSLYSVEHKKWFNADNSTARIEKDPGKSNAFRLTINGTDIIQWFRGKFEELQQKLGVKSRQTPEINRPKGPKLG